MIPSQFLMWERRSHAFPPHYTTAPQTPQYLTILMTEREEAPLSCEDLRIQLLIL